MVEERTKKRMDMQVATLIPQNVYNGPYSLIALKWMLLGPIAL